MSNLLDGLTRAVSHRSIPIENPKDHTPTRMANQLTVDHISPDGKKTRSYHYGNIMVTGGLSRIASLIATGGAAQPASTFWVNAMQIGTSTTAEASTQTALGASTGIVHQSQASMVISDQGARTTRWTATFASNNPAGTATINEVGLFFTTTAATTLIARSVLGTDSINKGASDVIQLSYDVIFTTG